MMTGTGGRSRLAFFCSLEIGGKASLCTLSRSLICASVRYFNNHTSQYKEGTSAAYDWHRDDSVGTHTTDKHECEADVFEMIASWALFV